MADDQPIEFRAAKRSSLADWVAARARHDSLIYAGAAAVLVTCGIAALIGTWVVLFGVCWALLAAVGLGWTWLIFLTATAATAGTFAADRAIKRPGPETFLVDLGLRGEVEVTVSRLTGASWLMILSSSSNLNPLVRLVANGLLLAPRTFRLAWVMGNLSRRLRLLDADTTARGVRLLTDAGARVPLEVVLDEFPDRDPQRILDELTAVDGVIFLARDPPGLAVTPALSEDYEAWRKEQRKRRDRR